MKMSMLKETSIIKTIIFNQKYFGWGGVIYPLILISKQVSLKKLSGEVCIATDERLPIGAIKIGYGDVGVIDKKKEKSIWENYGTVEFKGKTRMGIRTRICCKGHLIIGENCCFNSGADIICWKSIRFGKNCLISWDTLFMDTDFHKINSIENQHLQINQDKEIVVGNNVWIGCRVTILKGSIIADNSIVGAGSVITGQLMEKNTIYVNNHAIKSGIEWK